MKLKQSIIGTLTTAPFLMALTASPVLATHDEGDSSQPDPSSSQASHSEPSSSRLRDAWIDGKLETLYLFNTQLSPFDIQTTVNDGNVVLNGEVDSRVKRDLAEEIARNVKDVGHVTNHIAVVEKVEVAQRSEQDQALKRAIRNATAAAALKTRLLANDEISGLEIDVEVQDGIATLSGTVDDEAERQLAEYIALNTDGIDKVANRLEIRSAS